LGRAEKSAGASVKNTAETRATAGAKASIAASKNTSQTPGKAIVRKQSARGGGMPDSATVKKKTELKWLQASNSEDPAAQRTPSGAWPPPPNVDT
jgi:hypothetical protein